VILLAGLRLVLGWLGLADPDTGAELVDSILDVLRQQAENADSLQGFQVTHCELLQHVA
jgi:hypothetical protein